MDKQITKKEAQELDNRVVTLTRRLSEQGVELAALRQERERLIQEVHDIFRRTPGVLGGCATAEEWIERNLPDRMK